MKSNTDIINSLYEHFFAIYQLWEEKQSSALCKKMLENDVLLIGFHFAKVDEFGQIAKFNMVCEAIALIRMINNPVHNYKILDYWTDIVMEELQDNHLQASRSKKPAEEQIVAQLETWQLIIILHKKKQIDENLIENYLQALMELLDLFIMYDGNISGNEINILRNFENALQKTII
jgi:hypothetical protein